MKSSHVQLATELGIAVTETTTQKAYEDLVDLLSEDYNRVNELSEELEKLIVEAREAMEPFRFIANMANGFDTGRLAIKDWHSLSKACKAIDLANLAKHNKPSACLSRNHDGDILLVVDGEVDSIIAKHGTNLWLAISGLLY